MATRLSAGFDGARASRWPHRRCEQAKLAGAGDRLAAAVHGQLDIDVERGRPDRVRRHEQFGGAVRLLSRYRITRQFGAARLGIDECIGLDSLRGLDCDSTPTARAGRSRPI
jgi:hypothetical protein